MTVLVMLLDMEPKKQDLTYVYDASIGIEDKFKKELTGVIC